MHRFASHLGPERGDQSAAAQHVGESMITGVVEFEANLAGQIEPDGHFFFFPGSGIFFRQACQNTARAFRIAADQMTKQVRFGGFRNLLHVIDFAVAQSFEHELAVVFEGHEIHRLSSSLTVLPGNRRWRRQKQSLFQPIHGCQDLPVKFRQGHTALAESAIIFGQAADAGLVSRGERAETSLAGLTPGKHRRRVEQPLRFGAMAGRITTACLEVVDGAFDHLAMPKYIA